MDGLQERDVRALVEFAHETARVARVEPRRLARWAVESVPELVASDNVWQLEGRPGPSQSTLVRVRALDPRVEALRNAPDNMRLWEERFVFEHPLGAQRMSRPYEFRALRLSDFATQASFRRLEVYDLFFRPFDLAYLATVRYRGPLGFLDLTCGRTRCDFSDRDLLVLDLAAATLQVAVRDVGPQRRPALAASGVTRRESEVLELVARGRTNAEVADTLGIASGTVKKHLDDAFAKLGVRNRMEAARVWLEASNALDERRCV